MKPHPVDDTSSARFGAAQLGATQAGVTQAGGRDGMGIGRLGAIGLILAGIGWALLLGEATVADIVPAGHASARAPTFHADLCAIAECVIASGFALAIVGALQTGFGALNRFFEAVLMRSAQRQGAPVVMREEPAAEAPTPERPYRKMPDGSVEVDTILGTRRFSSVAEARAFI